MTLQHIEADFLTDLQQDTHGIWEVFESVRGHQPQFTDSQVFEAGRTLLRKWVRDARIVLSDKPLFPTTISTLDQALDQIDQLGLVATRYFDNAPSIDVAPTRNARI